MNLILDQFGQQTKFMEAARPSRQRTWQSSAARDFDELVSQADWATVVGASRRLWANSGVVRGTIDQKATYSVSGSFVPEFQGQDTAWGEQAKAWLSSWMELCEVRGPLFDFNTVLYLTSVAIDRDGDGWILLTETNGFPQIQSIPAHRIGQRDNAARVAAGGYKGLRIRKGVIFNKVGRAVAYRVLGEAKDGSEDSDVSARDLLHVFDPSFVDQSRGLPLFSHAVSAFRDISESREREMAAQLLLSSLAFVETNPYGGPDPDDVTIEYSSDGTPSCQSFEGGTVKFFKGGDGSKLEEVANNRPSQNWQAFHDRLIRDSLTGTGWPLSLVNMAQGNGTADRISLLQGRKAIEDRQSLLKPLAKRIINFALGKAIDSGILAPAKQWWNWNLSCSNRLSIDLGRDSASLREEIKLGMKNLTQILAEEGRTREDHIRERAEEDALRIKIRKEVSERYGFPIDPPLN
ncbi:phage portal protein [Haloferula sp. BvORR071]|uniref:phage portal protein n=1 Tax=Haloferula sp. BvORR071 TaxID=1396141 RepID=UPI00055081B5|nr:phage portal protein [Haloferula sp. BvORR071]